MQKKKIYISRSLLTDIAFIQKLKSELIQNGIHAYFYNDQFPYDSNLVKDADMVLVVPHDIAGYVGKGQLTEIELAQSKDIPVYFTDLDASLKGVIWKIIHNSGRQIGNDWKKDFARFQVLKEKDNLGVTIQKILGVTNNREVNDELLLTIQITSN